MGRSLLPSDSAHFEVGYLIADESQSDVARGLTNGHAVAVSTAGSSKRMPAAEELAPTSAHRAGYKHVRTTLASLPNKACMAGTVVRYIRAGP